MIGTTFIRSLCVVFAVATTAVHATETVSLDRQVEDIVSPERLAAREWFQDARLGMFIHWGMYSVLGQDCWVINNGKIPMKEYERLARTFNPVDFNAKEWVGLAKRNGFRYITFTTKHHDGFAMFDSKATDWDIVDRTPYRKDIVDALAKECRRQGIKLFLYYSQLDWHHPDYFPHGRNSNVPDRTTGGDWARYLKFMDTQLTELLTKYGPIGGIWFDGMWDKPDADWQLRETYRLIHRIQPKALVGSNHHVYPYPGEDFQMWERDLPGQNKAGFSHGQTLGNLPLETCDTINGAWAFNVSDWNFKTSHTLVQYMVRAAGNNANMLLNVGPMPNGEIHPELQNRFDSLGKWLDRNGESIYKTRGGPISPQEWGVSTHKKEITYLHVLDADKLTTNTVTADDGTTGLNYLLELPGMAAAGRAELLNTKEKLEFVRGSDGTSTISLPERLVDKMDTIITLQP